MSFVRGFNHLTLSVSDLSRSVAFYSELLGFEVRLLGPSSAYLEAASLWLALVLDESVRKGPLAEYTHAAFSVDREAMSDLADRLIQFGVACWQEAENATSFYFLDPDGHKLELHAGDLSTRLLLRAEQT